MSRPGAAGSPILLVLRALGLGDFLTGLPALRALVAAFPEHHLVLAMPPALGPLASLAGVGGDVLPVDATSRIEPVDRQWAAWSGLQTGVDVAVNLHGRGPDSHRMLLRRRPRRLIAFANPDVPEAGDGPRWRQDEHEVVRWCRLLQESGIPAERTRLELVPPPLEAAAPHLAGGLFRGATIIHPGAASGARRWPAERWAEVARHERGDGRTVVVTGGPSEVALATAVASRAGLPSEAVVAGRTDLVQLVAVVGAAGMVLSGDTGVAHLATAVGTPSVVLFGPTPPSRWGPPPERPSHAALWAGGVGDPHASQPHPGLLAITAEQVLAGAERARAAAAVVSPA